MTTYEIKKKGFTLIYTKRYVLDNVITTVPLLNVNMDIDIDIDIEEDEDKDEDEDEDEYNNDDINNDVSNSEMMEKILKII